MFSMLQRTNRLLLPTAALVAAFAAGTTLAADQFVPLLSYRVGAYAAGGSGIFGGYIDYMNYINMKEGGVNGVKLSWEECETEYNNSRGVECYERLKKQQGGASLVQPLSTGITYSLIDRVAVDKVPMVTIGYGRTDAANGAVFPWVFPMITTYWSQASTMIKYIAQKDGARYILTVLTGKLSYPEAFALASAVNNRTAPPPLWVDEKGKTISKHIGELKIIRPMPVACDDKTSGVVMTMNFLVARPPSGRIYIKFSDTTTVPLQEQEK